MKPQNGSGSVTSFILHRILLRAYESFDVDAYVICCMVSSYTIHYHPIHDVVLVEDPVGSFIFNLQTDKGSEISLIRLHENSLTHNMAIIAKGTLPCI